MINWWNGLSLVQQILAIFAVPATVILVIQTVMLLFGLGSGHEAGGSGGHEGSDISGGHETADLGSALHSDGGMHDAGALHDGAIGHDLTTDAHAGDGLAAQDAAHAVPGHHGAGEAQDVGLRLFTVRGLVAFFAIGGWVGIALIDVGLPPALACLLALLAGLGALVLIAAILRMSLGLQSSGNLDLDNAIGLIGDVYLRIPANQQGVGKVTIILQGRSIEIDALTEESEGIGTGSQVLVQARRGDRLVVKRLK
jgi:hypothetical protein